MSLNTKPPDFNSMTLPELQLALEKQLFIKKGFSSKLPDCGKKLDKSIARIQSILESKSYQPSPTSFRTPATKLIQAPSPLSTDCAVQDEFDNGVENLTESLGFLNLGVRKDEDDADIEVEALSKLPEEPLTLEEISHFRHFCKLPSLSEEDVSYHAFLFQLSTCGSDTVCLTVIDCRNSERRFVRYGTISTWAIEEGRSNQAATERGNVVVTAPGESIADLWRFVRSESLITVERPVLVACCERDLLRLRRLFCCPSVRHNPNARNGLPRHIRFVVGDVIGIQSEEHVQVDDLVKCATRFAQLNAASLAKMRPKTVVWLEAPINLQALRVIAQVPRGSLTSRPPYVASPSPETPTRPEPSGDRPTTKSENLPMLRSFENSLLIRLAAAGFVPSSLALLAGHGKWRGFAGLLMASHVTRCPEVLADLYRHFRRVYRGLMLNTDLYREDSSMSSGSPLWSLPSRRLKTLSMEESLKVMTRVRDEYKALQANGLIKVRPTMPPPSKMSLKYRNDEGEESDDTLCGKDSDDD